jgi:hypothetical protein
MIDNFVYMLYTLLFLNCRRRWLFAHEWPHGGGDGEPWARRVPHGGGGQCSLLDDVAGVLLCWLLRWLEIDAWSEPLRLSRTPVWRCGRCCRGEGVAVCAGVAWAGFLDVRLMGGRGGHCHCRGAAVEFPRARVVVFWWLCLVVALTIHFVVSASYSGRVVSFVHRCWSSVLGVRSVGFVLYFLSYIGRIVSRFTPNSLLS